MPESTTTLSNRAVEAVRGITARAGLWPLLAALFLLGQQFALATGHVLVSWDLVSDPDARYHLYYGTESRNYIKMIPVGNVNSAEVGNLNEGQTYYFAITTADEFGNESDYSEEIARKVEWVTSAGSQWLSQAQGTFNGLFYEPSAARVPSSGSFSLSLNSRASYSGRLRLGSSTYSLTGHCDSQGNGTSIIRRLGKTALTLAVQIGSGDNAGKISGRLSDGSWTADLAGSKASFNSRTNPAPWTGTYTLVLPDRPADPGLPGGCSYGTARVSASGLVSFAAVLADGTRVTQSATVSEDGVWPLHVPLYGGHGFLMSWLAFNAATNSDLDGTISWIKETNRLARYYPSGFTNQSRAIGSHYQAPKSGSLMLQPFRQMLAFSGGELVAGFSGPINLESYGRVEKDVGLSMSFSTGTGLFRGTVVEPSTGRYFTFSGAVLTKINRGYGSLMGINKSGRVTVGY